MTSRRNIVDTNWHSSTWTGGVNHRWVVFGMACLVYFFVYFHRVSTSVIADDLRAAFDVNATALGFMSSMYFYIYAFEQPLVGYLSDRIGPRRVIGYWTLIAAAGCMLFGAAPSIGWATAGRAMIGFGVGGVYVPTIKAISLWFRAREFATMVGILMAIGNLGAVIATTPLAWAAGLWGWRHTFYLIGAASALLALATLCLTRDYREPASNCTDAAIPPTPPTSAAKVLLSGQFWIIAVVFFAIYGTLITLQGLWAAPYLMSAFAIDRILASQLNMLIPVGVIIGAPLFGWLPDRFALDKRRTLIGILAAYVLTWVGITFFTDIAGVAGIGLLFLVMGGAGGAFLSTLWGIIRIVTPPAHLGLTSGILNPAPFLGVAAFQVLTGSILDRSATAVEPYTLSGFHNAFVICLVCSAVCLAVSFLLRTATTDR